MTGELWQLAGLFIMKSSKFTGDPQWRHNESFIFPCRLFFFLINQEVNCYIVMDIIQGFQTPLAFASTRPLWRTSPLVFVFLCWRKFLSSSAGALRRRFFSVDCSIFSSFATSAMALRNALLRISRKSLHNDTSTRVLLQRRALHSSTVPEEPARDATDAELKHAGPVKSLREMPGPSAIGNLIEFFYRDGFSRIHEIQVQVSLPCN